MSKIIHQWKSIALVEEDVLLPNGHSVTHTTISHPGAAVILPLTDQGEIVVIRQFRPSLKKWLLELPAGTIEEGEPPLSRAQRELRKKPTLALSNLSNSVKSRRSRVSAMKFNICLSQKPKQNGALFLR